MKTFKIRCSQIGKIMTEPKTKHAKSGEFLSETAKTYCQTWVKEQIYQRKKEFASKTIEKGLIVEDHSIDFIAEILGLRMLMKNEQPFENEYMSGTPDIILQAEKMTIDVKNSWDCFTFPLFESKIPTNDYYWQAQGYMELTESHKHKVIYVLSDTPVNIIERETYHYCRNNGYADFDEDIYHQLERKMTYKDIPNKYKIKIFDIEKNEYDIQQIKKRVQQCRNYINDIIINQ